MTANRRVTYVGNGDLVIDDGKTDSPDSGEVLLRVAYTGICGTDLHILHGHMDDRVEFPAVLGHETSGTIVELGSDVTTWEMGDRVAVLPVLPCRTCRTCRKGDSHVCPNLDFMGIDTTGAMQDFWVVPSTTLFPLPDTVSLQHGAMIEPLAVASHSVRRSRLNEGDRALIAGAGPIGTLIALVAKTVGAKVMVSEPSPQRRSNAEAIGLETIDPLGQQFDAVIAEWSDGEGVDVGFEAAASPSATESMIANLAARGRLVPVGIHSGPVPVDLFRVFWRELEIIGSRLYGPVDYRKAIELANRGEIPFERLITDVVGIDEIERAFSDLESGRATKVLVEFGGNELG